MIATTGRPDGLTSGGGGGKPQHPLRRRTLPGATDLPVGVLTAVLGAPYPIFLFVRGRQEARG